MLIYNQISELVYDQFLALFLIEIVVTVITLFIFKNKLSPKLLIFSSTIALVLSLLSVNVVRGTYGGTFYHEGFGWPFHFQWISRDINDISNIEGVRFNGWKFIANTIYWGIFPLLILAGVESEKKNKTFQLFLIGTITSYLLVTSYFSYANNRYQTEATGNPVQEAKLEVKDLSTSALEIRKMDSIEMEYPEFKGFEENTSFAGTSVRVQTHEDAHYFAYVLHGSGFPIAQATCFRVDRLFRVYKVGEFPDYADSYMGYMDVEPMNCSGIK